MDILFTCGVMIVGFMWLGGQCLSGIITIINYLDRKFTHPAVVRENQIHKLTVELRTLNKEIDRCDLGR